MNASLRIRLKGIECPYHDTVIVLPCLRAPKCLRRPRASVCRSPRFLDLSSCSLCSSPRKCPHLSSTISSPGSRYRNSTSIPKNGSSEAALWGHGWRTELGVRATTLTHILLPTKSASRSLARGHSIVPKSSTRGRQAADGSLSPSATSGPLNLHRGRGHSRSSYPLVFTAGCRLRTRFRPHPEAICLRGAGHEPGLLIASER